MTPEEEIVAAALTSIEKLRRVEKTWSTQDGPAELHEALIAHRRALDSMEPCVVALQRMHSRARDAATECRHKLEDAETKASALRDEYTTAKEKDIHIRTQTVEERVALRRAERSREVFWDALEIGRIRHRGLNDSRRDLETRIRLISLTTSLER